MTLPGTFKPKFLPVSNLVRLLKKLPSDAVVMTNSANNLSVYRIVEGKLESFGLIGFDDSGEFERD